MTRKFFLKNNQAGFTIVEMMITIFIFTIIGIAVVFFQIDIFSLNKISNNNLIIQEEARRALKMITSEIRSMSPSALGAYPLVLTATSSLTFYSNIDTDILPEKIRYFLDGTTLKKGVTKSTDNPLTYNPAHETVQELIHNIANATTSIFSYYDTDYDGVSAPLAEPVDITLVRLIKTDIIIDEDQEKLSTPLYMTTQVSIRNLKDNL